MTYDQIMHAIAIEDDKRFYPVFDELRRLVAPYRKVAAKATTNAFMKEIGVVGEDMCLTDVGAKIWDMLHS